MVEMLKSKTIIAFIVVILGVTFLNADYEVKLEETHSNDYLTSNIK